MKVKISDIKLLDEYYPRDSFNNELVNNYLQNVDALPAITLTKDLILVDGKHRIIAHQLAGYDEIEAEEPLLDLTGDQIYLEAIRRNAFHGSQLTLKEKRKAARRLYQDSHKDTKELRALLGVGRSTIDEWLKDLKKQEREKRNQEIIQSYKSGCSIREIASSLGIPHRTVHNVLISKGIHHIPPRQLQDLVIQELGGKPNKSSPDRGIDGFIDNQAIQVKDMTVYRPHVDQFTGALVEHGISDGILVARHFSSGVAKATSQLKAKGINIQLRTISEILDDDQVFHFAKSSKMEQVDEQRIIDLYLQCLSNNEISQRLGISVEYIRRKLFKFFETAIKNLKPPTSLRLTNVWNFQQCDVRYGLDYPGRIPGQIIENLLYYYTEPFDLVVDPMAGGGTTIDVCKAMVRRYQAYDIKPVREDIKRHDIRGGFPAEVKQAALIILDPPYWRLNDSHYGDQSVSASSYEEWLMFMKSLAENCSKVIKNGGHIALIVEPFLDEKITGAFLDLTFECLALFKKAGFKQKQRISIPMPSQIKNHHDIEYAKDRKVLLDINRDLLILGKE